MDPASFKIPPRRNLPHQSAREALPLPARPHQVNPPKAKPFPASCPLLVRSLLPALAVAGPSRPRSHLAQIRHEFHRHLLIALIGLATAALIFYLCFTKA